MFGGALHSVLTGLGLKSGSGAKNEPTSTPTPMPTPTFSTTTSTATLYRYRPTTRDFAVEISPCAWTLTDVADEDGTFQWELHVADTNLATLVTPYLNPRYDASALRVTFQVEEEVREGDDDCDDNNNNDDDDEDDKDEKYTYRSRDVDYYQDRVSAITTTIYALVFSDRSDYDRFAANMEVATFENQYQKTKTKETELMVRGYSGFESWFEGNNDDALFAEAMEVDEEGEVALEREERSRALAAAAASAAKAQPNGRRLDDDPRRVANNNNNDDDDALLCDAFRFMSMGAGDSSFAVREGGYIDVFRNTHGGLLDAGVSIRVTGITQPNQNQTQSTTMGTSGGGGGGGGGGGIRTRSGSRSSSRTNNNTTSHRPAMTTPAKTLLMEQERHMLLMSQPDRSNGDGRSSVPRMMGGGAGSLGSGSSLATRARSEAASRSGIRSLYKMDIEREKVVHEYGLTKDGVAVPVLDVTHPSKKGGGGPSDADGDGDGGSTFLALDLNRLCQFDTRTAEGCVADLCAVPGRGKDYASGSKGPQFTCMVSAGDGSVVTGSADGSLRLYKGMGNMTRATTKLPSYGFPITSVDVTFDGKWVLATTDRFLVLQKTAFRDEKNRLIITTGFQKSMNGGNSCAPRMLRLSREDEIIVGQRRVGGTRMAAARFENARFDWKTSAGSPERWIMATIGSYTVMWNLQKIVRGEDLLEEQAGGGGETVPKGMRAAGCYAYQLQRSDESVVDAHFVHDRWRHRNGDDAVVVVTSHHVYACDGEEEADEASDDL